MAEPVIATPAAEPTAPGAPSATPAAVAADAADFAAAVAALQATETPAPATPAPVTPEPAKEPEKAPEPAPKPEPTEDARALLARMARLEFEAEQAREEAAKLRSGTELASKMAKIQELKASRDFAGVLQELGVTPDELQTMILEGNKPVDPKIRELEKTAQELRAFKEQQEAQRQAAERAAAQREFKATQLAPQLSAEKYPLARAVYGDGLVDEVFAVLQFKYQNGDRNPSVSEAAKVVEDYCAGMKARLAPSQAAAAPAQTSAPAVPTTTTLTNVPTSAPAVAADMDTDEGRFQAAMKVLKGN